MTSCLPGWGGAEGRLSQIKCVESFEHRVEARDTQDIPDPFRGVHQLQVSSLLVGVAGAADQSGQPGAVNIMDLRHIYDNAVPALIKQPLHFLLQAAGPVAQDNSPPQLEEGESIQGFFLNAEAHWFASRFAE